MTSLNQKLSISQDSVTCDSLTVIWETLTSTTTISISSSSSHSSSSGCSNSCSIMPITYSYWGNFNVLISNKYLHSISIYNIQK